MTTKHEFNHDVKLDVAANVRQGVKALLEEVLQEDMTQQLEAGYLRLTPLGEESAFVAGRYRYIDFDGSPLPIPQPPRPEGDRYSALLRDNRINMHAVVMYQRAVFEYVGGFDVACEDYDMYLRIARDYPIGCHIEIIVEDRQHEVNPAEDLEQVLNATITILRSLRIHTRDKEGYKRIVVKKMKKAQNHSSRLLLAKTQAKMQVRKWRDASNNVLLLRSISKGFVSTAGGSLPWF